MPANRRTALDELLALPEPERRVGPYHLLEALGKGTFAPVWLARRIYGTTFEETAAVKLFSLDAGGEGLRERIEREAEALRRSRHPNVVRVLGLEEDRERGILGLAMEHVDGTPLHKQLRPGNEIHPLPVLEVIAVGVAVSSALSKVHDADLIHRDIKPSNIVRSRGVYKLIDFGIASPDRRGDPSRPEAPSGATAEPDLDDEVEMIGDLGPIVDVRTIAEGASPSAPVSTVSLTSSEDDVGDVHRGDGAPGTIGYKDPRCGEPTWGNATRASDLYGLGATLFECLTGSVPALVGRLGADYDKAILTGRSPAPSLLSLVPGAPPDLGRLIARLLDPDPGRRPRSAAAVVEELLRIRDALRGRKRPLPPDDRGPFRGLTRFEQDDCGVFFGRDPEIAAALEVIGRAGLTAIAGPSGSGKSSLIRAGVLPRVAEGALGPWPAEWGFVIASPGADPFGSLVEALADVVPGADALSADAIVTALAERVYATGQGVVVIVDQFEEMITLTRVDSSRQMKSRARAVELLERIHEESPVGLRVIVATRLDFLGDLLSLGGGLAVALTRNLVPVSPMVQARLGDVLQEALAAYDHDFEDAALRDEVAAQIRELDADAAMPLVQFALEQLWQKRDRDRRRITRAAFRETGGIPGMLDRYADQVLDEIEAGLPRGSKDARQVLTALTTPQGTRATLSLAELSRETAFAEAVLIALEKGRLVVREGTGYKLAHEALLERWGRLRAWVGAARAHRRLKEELEADAKRWEAKADSALLMLWTGTRLRDAIELRGAEGVRLSPGAVRFVETARKRVVRWIVTVVALVVVALGAGTATALFVIAHERDQAEHATRLKDDAEQAAREAQAAEERTKDANLVLEWTTIDAELAARDAEDATGAAQKEHEDFLKQVEANKACRAEAAKERAKQEWARPPGVQ